VLAAVAWLVYAHTGGSQNVRWRGVRLGHVEFTRKVSGVYRSRRSLERLLASTMPGRAPRAPAVDFKRDEVVVVSLGPRSSSGYALKVVRLVERRRGIYLTLREQTPSLGEPVAARVTYPYLALAVPRTGKSLYVKLQGRP
jgi:protease stability complex PrcB-like protein